MDYMEVWNEIVDDFKNNRYSKEDIIQALWESKLRKMLHGGDCEFVKQKPVKMGVGKKKADIVIQQNGKDVAVVELKQHTLSRSAGQGQLFSYLNQLKLVKIGILVCDKLYIYDYDVIKSDEENERNCLEIPFEKDSELGAKFVELFSKKQFDSEKVHEFIAEKIRSALNIKNLREEITNSKELIIGLLKKEFTSKYDEAEFDEVMKEFDIQIVKKVPAEVFAPKIHGTIVHIPLAGKEKKGDLDKLQEYIRTVGMSTFVKYYEQFANPHFDPKDVKQVMRNNGENWKPNSFDTKASAGKWITQNGYGEEALKRIAGANKTDSETIQKALELLRNINK